MNPSTYIRLSELNAKISEAIDRVFHGSFYWVIAEITSHTYRSETDYHHFELVEKDPGSSKMLAKIAGKSWGSGSSRIAEFESKTGQKFTNNIQVLIKVSVEYHPIFGLQITLLDIDESFTIGQLAKQRQWVLDKLVAENDFIQLHGDRFITRNNQLALPPVIQSIALISSRTSAGAEDFKHTLINNSWGYRFMIDDYFATVQGENNAIQFVNKLIEVFQSKNAYDAVIIIRGGGAQTDFLIFDNYRIGLAIAKFPIPVITGIGHQKNETIADLMAHTATKTPTMAAEFLVSHNRIFEEALLKLRQNILIKAQQRVLADNRLLELLKSRISHQTYEIINENKDTLSYLQTGYIQQIQRILKKQTNMMTMISNQMINAPRLKIQSQKNELINTLSKISIHGGYYIKNQSVQLTHLVSLIKVSSPAHLLNKGFAIVRQNGKIINNGETLKQGDEIEVILKDIALKTSVINKKNYDRKEFDL